MVYLLGVDHSYQSYYSEKFRDYITTQVKTLKLVLLAEEYSNEAKEMFHPSEESQLYQIAQDINVEHLYCDPTTKERKSLGIEDGRMIHDRLKLSYKAYSEGTEEHKILINEKKKQWIIREKEWLRRLSPKASTNTLFVLGASHTKRFARLLKNFNIPYFILDNNEFQNEIPSK